MGLAFRIGEPNLVHIIASAFVCSLLVVARCHVLGDDAHHCVAHHKEAVESVAGAGDEVCLEGRLALEA